ncbi:MAG: hypothetical protein COV72_01790 [Candidatus Omnitrophica bacterium CG11_big_fil_rev_8_21_14_0_20_42_13]|uniref:diguanylate cyclase n=1 Tax=Candidatus Ghiorseimicrobium undicola TaxID=1974746 RepID=A0A2H0LZ15_9BACT|nr:MAG: hypothetical protein COV72_01790 [Candidatus Omnitrophica bacterium CG11_big_fil_rev_8_21_14_0_20_42_13]
MNSRHFHRICIIIGAFILISSYARLLPRFAFFSPLYYSLNTDLFLRYRHSLNELPDIIDKIVIIDIDESSLGKLNQRWPINRGFFAPFLKKISRPDSKPAVIGFDLIFSGKSDLPESDILFSGALKDTENVVIASYFDEKNRLIMPEALFSNAAKAVGFTNYPRDSGSVIRRAYPFSRLKSGRSHYSFTMEIIASLNKLDLEKMFYGQDGKSLRIPSFAKPPRSVNIPIDRKTNTARINYFAKFKDFNVIPFWEILSSKVPAEELKDKIVLIGNTIDMVHDIHPTPLGRMPGIAINANLLMSILSDRPLRETAKPINFFILSVIALIIGFTTYSLSNLKGLVLTLAVIVSAFYASVLCISKDIVFDFLGASFTAAASFIIITALKYLFIIIENAHLKKLATTDGLTGLYVFRYFEAKLNSEIKNAQKAKTELSLVIFDIDNFKKINDTYGHDAGNEVLKNTAALISRQCRKNDTVARFGGEEFVAILPSTNAKGANIYAEKIRKAIEEFDFPLQERTLKVTVSAGTASLLLLNKPTAEGLLKAADTALYEAKTSGKNKIVCGTIKS